MERSIYLAGPDVFLENPVEVGVRKRDLCQEAGFKGLFPIDNEAENETDATSIFAGNIKLMDQADIGLFNLTPFRGPSGDAGTLFELGYMYGLGKPIYGYSSSTQIYADRVEAQRTVLRAGRAALQEGYQVEGFGLADNLMIVEAILERRGRIFHLEEEEGEPLAAFRAFRACLDAIRADHSEGS